MFPWSPPQHQRNNPHIQPLCLSSQVSWYRQPYPALILTLRLSKLIILVSSDIARPDTNPASVSIETSRHLAPASANWAAAHTSSLLSPHISSAQLQPDLEIRSFLIPAPAGSDSIPHLANSMGASMSSAPDIDTAIKGCQFQTISAPPPSAYHPATPLLQSSQLPSTSLGTLTPSGTP